MPDQAKASTHAGGAQAMGRAGQAKGVGRIPPGTGAPRPASAAQQIMQITDACAGDPDFMVSFARGMAVLRAFTDHRRPLGMSQIAQDVGISRAAVRRALHTLIKLGYAVETAEGFALSPRVLGIGNAYLSSFSLAGIAQPVLDALRDHVHESCSLGVLDGDDVLYLARAETVRIMSVSLRPGSRIPAYCSSMGRVLLAHGGEDELAAYLRRVPLRPCTGRTVVDEDRLRQALANVERQGYAVVDQELELGLRSIAVPVCNRERKIVAAINIGTQTTRTPLRRLENDFLPALMQAARHLEEKYF